MKSFDEQIKNITDILLKMKFSQYQLKVFLINLILVFAMVVLQHMHLKPPAFVSSITNVTSPIPEKINIFNSIVLPKLELIENNYQLKKESSLIPGVSAAGDYDQASAYIVTNYDTGEVLAEKESATPLAIASLTKIMTSTVALDLASPDERFTVTQRAADMEPTKIGVVAGQSLTLRELLHAALMTSANDAVEVIKDGLNNKFSEDDLVRAMNAKATYLGLKNTHFTNPQGFDISNPYSTAEDLAVLSHYALENYPLIETIVKKEYQYLPEDEFHKKYDLYNWNGLLGVYPGVYGIKIGNTDLAGTTTVVISEREGKRVLVVLLGTPGIMERDYWASQLLDLGFSKFDIDPANVTKSQLKEKYSTWKYWN